VVDFRDLVKAGVHFGHQTARWNPKMAPYIWGHRGGIHLIDVSKTAYYLEQAAKFLQSVAAQKKQILWVGTKKSARDSIVKLAKELDMPYVANRWIGGTLTNFPQVKKSVTKLLHFEDIIARSSEFTYKKKEVLTFQKIVDRLERNIGGIRHLKWPIGAIVVVDVRKEKTVLSEARQAGIPIVALVDSNSDPLLIDYVIPGNDDSPKAVSFVIDYLGEAVKRGIAEAAKKEKESSKGEGEVAASEKGRSRAKGVASKIVKKVAEKVTKKAVVDKKDEKAAVSKAAPKKDVVKAKSEKLEKATVENKLDVEKSKKPVTVSEKVDKSK